MRSWFGGYVLDTDQRQLLCDESPVHLPPKAFELLALLVTRRPAAVSKREIQQALWPDAFVNEGNLFKLVFQVRRALGGEARRLRTVNRFGYAFGGARPVEGEAVPAGGLL
jgi:DNA-binding winged helix-turn-helix (wHTH) protein